MMHNLPINPDRANDIAGNPHCTSFCETQGLHQWFSHLYAHGSRQYIFILLYTLDFVIGILNHELSLSVFRFEFVMQPDQAAQSVTQPNQAAQCVTQPNQAACSLSRSLIRLSPVTAVRFLLAGRSSASESTCLSILYPPRTAG